MPATTAAPSVSGATLADFQAKLTAARAGVAAWGGAVLGLVLSIAVAFVLQAVFSQVAGGQNRELIEGITSLIAAGLLIYVSYWLHSKASLRGWQRYIDAGTTKALAKGNLIGLGLLAL